MSPRAACRLETLGFEHVHDYVPGKADWLAHNLPVERKEELITAGQQARNNVVTCGLDDHVGEVSRRIAESPYGFAMVLSNTGVLLGRLRSSALDVPPDTPVEQRMESGPSTIRPDTPADQLAQRLRDRDLKTAIVSTPEGHLIGVTRRDDHNSPHLPAAESPDRHRAHTKAGPIVEPGRAPPVRQTQGAAFPARATSGGKLAELCG